ncbi:uncharacterized protein G2W53_001136 [Senna tora]|uniref:Uncharacterized protein n=1 Tax=Senna tora TaxID=362788 RepID=A0A835CK24_9FABA|nr:uncharacterized protein G2W53_001136 [Senna tora]
MIYCINPLFWFCVKLDAEKSECDLMHLVLTNGREEDGFDGGRKVLEVGHEGGRGDSRTVKMQVTWKLG